MSPRGPSRHIALLGRLRSLSAQSGFWQVVRPSAFMSSRPSWTCRSYNCFQKQLDQISVCAAIGHTRLSVAISLHRATFSSSVKPMITVCENGSAQRTSYIGVYPPCRTYGGAEPPIRTIIVAVIHIPIHRWVLLEISVVRRDLCHSRHSCHAQYEASLFIRANP